MHPATLRIRLFGGLTVSDSDGNPIPAIEGQRRVLALLALLAVAGDRGLSRDKLVGYLWPESDSERARHSLTQALYAARRLSGVDDLFDAGAVVHLNRSAAASDVEALEAALAAHDANGVLRQYTGAFLDGFFVAGAAELEHWITMQRAHYEERVVQVADAAAERADAQGNALRALELRRRVAQVRPFDSKLAARLVRSLVATGNRGEALRVAREHEQLLRSQLDVAPDQAFVDAVHTARASMPVARDEPARSIEPSAERSDTRQPDLRHSGWRRVSRRAVLVAAGAFAAVAVVMLGIANYAIGAQASTQSPISHDFIVAPFSVAGANRALAYLRDGFPELLTVRLESDSARWPSDSPSRGIWAAMRDSTALSRTAMLEVARRMRARWVAAGSVIGTPAHVVIDVSLVDVATGGVHSTERVEGSADTLSALVDAVAVRLLVAAAGEDGALAEHPPRSLAALRDYIEAQKAYRESDFAAARRGYERALLRDSTFAPAALRLALTTERLRWRMDAEPAVMSAWNRRRTLNPMDEARLAALAGPKFPAPSPAGAQLAAWQRVVRLQPSHADAWFDFASHLFYEGNLLGVPGALDRARMAVERALVLDPNHVAARALELELRIRAIDEGRERGDADSLAAEADSLGVFALPTRWHLAEAAADSDELRALRDTLPELDRMTLRNIVMASVFGQVNLDDGWRAATWLRRRAQTRAEAVDAELALHSVALNSGRVADALAATTRLSELRPDSHAYLRLRVLDALYASGDSAAAANAAMDLASAASLPSLEIPWAQRVEASDACVAAQWRLAHGDTSDVARTIAMLGESPSSSELPPVSASPIACADLLDATLAVQLHQRNAGDRLAALDSLLFTGVTAGNAASYVYIALARLHQRMGDLNGALSAIRRRPFFSGWAPYLSAASFEESRLATAAGDHARARAARASTR